MDANLNKIYFNILKISYNFNSFQNIYCKKNQFESEYKK